MEIELGASDFWHGLPGSASKKNYPAVKIHPGKFEDEPGWRKVCEVRPQIFQDVFLRPDNFFLDGDATADALFFAKAGLTPMVPMYLSGRLTGF